MAGKNEMTNNDTHEAMKLPAVAANRVVATVLPTSVRIAFLEHFTTENRQEVYGRAAVMMSRADAVDLKDLLTEMLKDGEPPQSAAPATRQ